MSLISALSLAASAVSQTAIPVADIPKPPTFGDWIVACDNVRSCEGLAAKEYAGDDWLTMSIKRGAGALDQPIVVIGPAFSVEVSSGTVRIDGQATSFAIDARGNFTGDPVEFLQAMARGRKAEVISADGTVIGKLATTGASAALRWLDDQQKRAGTQTAIIATGPKPASAVPPAPALPTIAMPTASTAPPRTLEDAAITAVKKAGECFGTRGTAEYFRLDAAHSMGIVPCNFGAYQGYSMIVTIREDGAWSLARLEMARAWPKEWGEMEAWAASSATTANFDPDTRLLSEFAKGRGLADCGHAAVWAWDGAVFRMASYHEMNECRGTQPDNWPSLWQTTNAQTAIAN